MPVGPYSLWPESDVEVAVERLHVDRHVVRRLRAVDQHRRRRARAPCATIVATGLTVPSAFDTCADRHDPRARRQQPLELVEIELAAIVDRHHAQRARRVCSQTHLPRHDVRVVLHRRDEHLVAGLQRRAAEALRHQVDALGRALA